jgi:hypothetical protein
MAVRMKMDPLQHGFPFPFMIEYFPLGFPVQVVTNSEAVIEAARESWGGFPKAFDTPALELRVMVEEGGAPAREPEFRAQRHLITIASDAANFAVCDHTHEFCFCRLSASTAANRSFVSYYFLEAMAYFCLTQLYVTPVHGACVARNGRGVMLCGPSGAGKSTLAYACARRGWTYISDNESWLLRKDARTMLGNPLRIRLRQDAVALFPELAGQPVVATFNGKCAIVLPTENLNTAFCCEPVAIVWLERRSGALNLAGLPAPESFQRLFDDVIEYSPEISEQHNESLRRFAELPSFTMPYDSLDQALALLDNLVRHV